MTLRAATTSDWQLTGCSSERASSRLNSGSEIDSSSRIDSERGSRGGETAALTF